MENRRYTKDDALLLLKKKQEELDYSGNKRYPQRSDFSEPEVVAIKAFLGPWPRALEKAGLKPVRDDGKAERMKEKRILQKRRRRIARFGGNGTSENE